MSFPSVTIAALTANRSSSSASFAISIPTASGTLEAAEAERVLALKQSSAAVRITASVLRIVFM